MNASQHKHGIRAGGRTALRAVILTFGLTLGLTLGLSAAALAAPVWQPLPPFGGPVQALAASPGAAGILYAGTQTGGALHSLDGGATWVPSEQGLTSVRLFRVAVDPRQPAVVFASTFKPFSDDPAGVFRSTDGGAHWTPANHGLGDGLGDGHPLVVRDLVFDPFDASRLYAATDQGLFATRDQGQSWQQAGLAGTQILALAADPFHRGTLLASVVQGHFALLASTDGGATWVPRSQGITGDPAFELLYFDPTSRGRVFATGNGWPTFLSHDSGVTWTRVEPPLTSLTAAPGALFASPYGKDGVLRSTNGGLTWAHTGSLPDRIAQVVFGDGRILAAGTRGVWVSTDNGAHWRPSSHGLSARTVRDLTASGPALYISVAEGVLASTDQGTSWRLLSDKTSPQSTIVRLLAAVPGALYALASPAGLLRSTNGGATWAPLDSLFLGGYDPSLAVDPRHPATLYAGSHYGNGPDQIRCHLAVSHDTGASWTCLATEIGVDSLRVEPTTSTLYILGGSLEALSNGHLEPRVAGLPQDTMEDIAFDPATAGTIYAATAKGIYKTTNGGRSWHRTSRGLPAGAAHAVAVDPHNKSTVYAGTNGRVYRSQDGGSSWQLFGGGLPAGVAITALTLDPRDADRLYAVAQGRGLYAVDPDEP
jgi:photosystem II stability/assembly factor-like uncharacterized protein